MSRRAVVFGAGNIGRGFIGQLFSESGYLVTFVDIDAELVGALRERGSYRLETVRNEDVELFEIGPVTAINGGDADAVAEAVSQAGIVATAVGAGALKFIAPPLALGIGKRMACGAAPLNVLLCENLKGAAATFRDMVRAQLPSDCQGTLSESVGFVDTVIGRMVPNPTPAMRAEDVSLIRVEPYKELPVDRAGFVGEIPSIEAMMPEGNFPLFTARKLYIHNCGHALLAYTGYLRGHVYGYDTLSDPAVRAVLQGGLAESIAGIVAKHGADREWLEEHMNDLLERFANRALGDPVLRLGRDPMRKLKPGDRLVGAAQLAVDAGQLPRHLAWGIAAALHFGPDDDPSAQELQQAIASQGVAGALRTVTGIEPDSPLGQTILEFYAVLEETPTADVRSAV